MRTSGRLVRSTTGSTGSQRKAGGAAGQAQQEVLESGESQCADGKKCRVPVPVVVLDLDAEPDRLFPVRPGDIVRKLAVGNGLILRKASGGAGSKQSGNGDLVEVSFIGRNGIDAE